MFKSNPLGFPPVFQESIISLCRYFKVPLGTLGPCDQTQNRGLWELSPGASVGSGLPDPQGALYEPISGPKKPFNEYIDYWPNWAKNDKMAIWFFELWRVFLDLNIWCMQ